MLQQGRLGSTDPTLIARDMEDVRQKISGSRVAESLNDLPGFLKAMDSQELGHARYRIVEGARQRLRPRRRKTAQPAGNDQQARGRLLNVEDVGGGEGPQPKQANQRGGQAQVAESKDLQSELKHLAFGNDRARLGATREVGGGGSTVRGRQGAARRRGSMWPLQWYSSRALHLPKRRGDRRRIRRHSVGRHRYAMWLCSSAISPRGPALARKSGASLR